MESAHVNLLLAEYRPRIKYRYISNDDIRQHGISSQKYLQDQDIYKEIDDVEKDDEQKVIALIWDAFEYCKHAIQSNDCLTSLKLKYNEIGKGAAITNFAEIPKDI